LVFAVVDRKVPQASVLVPLCLSIATGKSSLPANGEMDALIKAADKSGPVWATGFINNTMKTFPLAAPFDSVTVSSHREKERIKLIVSGVAHPPEQASVTAGIASGLIVAALTQIHGLPDKGVALQPVSDVLRSIKVALTDTGASATGEAAADFGRAMLVPLDPVIRKLLDVMVQQESSTRHPAPVSQ
jgi:hypothetical protein